MRFRSALLSGIALLIGQAAAATAPQPASSGGPGTTTHSAVLTPPQLFDLAERYANAHRLKEAEAMLTALTQNPDADIRAEARFRLGNLYRSIGDLRAAAHAYRQLLDEKPNANPVRLELARVLAQLGEDDAARSQLRRASSAGLPDDVSRIVDQFQQALRSNRRWGANLEVDLAPDSNINHAGTRATIGIGNNVFTLSKDAQAQSGLGASLSGQMYWRPKVSTNVNWLSSLSGSALLYGKSRFDDVSLTAASGPELLIGKSRLRLGGLVSRRWFGGDVYSDSYGGTANLLQPVSRTSQLQLDLTVLDNRYRAATDMTGASITGQIRYEFALSPRTFGRVSILATRQNARAPAFATWTAGAELLLSRDIGRQTIYGRGGFYRTVGDGDFDLPPAGRNDRLLDLEAGLLIRSLSFKTFVPVVRFHYTRNQSPVFFYEYDRKRVEVGLTHEF